MGTSIFDPNMILTNSLLGYREILVLSNTCALPHRGLDASSASLTVQGNAVYASGFSEQRYQSVTWSRINCGVLNVSVCSK